MATIAVDFDGTIVTHEYPKIGTELPFATETLKMLIRDHHKLILWSVREGKLLDEAVEWCRGGLPDWGEIYQIITNHTSYRQILKQQMGEVQEAPKKKHWWSRG